MCLQGTQVPCLPKDLAMIDTKSKHVQAKKLTIVTSYYLLFWEGHQTIYFTLPWWRNLHNP
jgi:hypothetical protein